MAIALTNQSDNTWGNGEYTTEVNLTHSVDAGSQRVLVVIVSWNNDNLETIDSVTWDPEGANQALTPVTVDPYVSIDDAASQAFYLVNPTAGASKNVEVIFDVEPLWSCGVSAWSLTGCDTSDPIRDEDGDGNNSASSLTATLSLAESGDFIAAGGNMEINTSAAWTSSSITMTEVQDVYENPTHFAAAHGTADGGSETITCTWTSTDHCALAAVAIAPVSTNFIVEGVTYDKDGDVLGSVNCLLFKDNQDDSISYVDKATSNASTGVYQFTYVGDNDAQYLVYGYKGDTPHVFDVTDHVCEPKEVPTASYDLYLRSDADKSETSPDNDLRLRSDADKLSTDPTASTFDIIALTESVDAFIDLGPASAADLVAITEAVAGQLSVAGISEFDGVGVSESVDAILGVAPITVADGVGVAESTTVAIEPLGLQPSVSDTVAVSESIGDDLDSIIQDVVIDVVSAGVEPSVADLVGVAESVSANLTIEPAQFELIGVAEAVPVDLAIEPVAADLVAVSESQQGDEVENAVDITRTVGTDDGGNYLDTHIEDSFYMDTGEATGTPGFDIRATFQNLAEQYGEIILIGYYIGNPAHKVKAEIYNYSADTWDGLTNDDNDFPSGASPGTYIFQVPTANRGDYFSASSQWSAQVRFYHSSPGNPAHVFRIDYLAFRKRYVEISSLEALKTLIYEALGVSESVAATLPLGVAVAETIAASESIGPSVPLSGIFQSNAIAITEFKNLLLGLVGALYPDGADDVTVGEFVAALVELSPEAFDQLGVSEAVEVLLNLAAAFGSDQIGVSEVVALVESISPAVSQTAVVAEYVKALLRLSPEAIDQIGIAEAFQAIVQLKTDGAESIGIAEFVETYLNLATITGTEQISVSEFVALLKDLNPALSETIAIGELVKALIALNATSADNVKVGELVAIILAVTGIESVDNFFVQESANVLLEQFGIQIQTGDAIGVAEAITILKDIGVDISQTIGVSELIEALLTLEANPYTNVAVNEFVDALLALGPTASENISLGEYVNAFLNLSGVAKSDNIGIAEIVGATIELLDLQIYPVEGVGVAEFVNALVDLAVISASDDVAVVEFAQVIIQTIGIDVAVSDNIGLLEFTLAALDLGPEAFDNLRLTEIVAVILEATGLIGVDNIRVDEFARAILDVTGIVAGDDVAVLEVVAGAVDLANINLDALAIGEFVDAKVGIEALLSADAIAVVEHLAVLFDSVIATGSQSVAVQEFVKVLVESFVLYAKMAFTAARPYADFAASRPKIEFRPQRPEADFTASRPRVAFTASRPNVDQTPKT